MNEENRIASLDLIKKKVIGLKRSPLYKYRISNNYFPVLGEGSHKASLMFVGEAPGANEAKQGRPFCGASGKILDKLIASIGINRSSVYITNIIKDRPPKNRDPLPSEIAIYSPFLIKQIDIIKPRIIATLGRIPMAFILEKFGLKDKLQTIGKIHGKVFEAPASYGEIKIIALYHPAVGAYNSNTIKIMKRDFKILKKLLNNNYNKKID